MTDDTPGRFDQPLVSVVIPTYNAGSYLTEAIDSVLAQTYRHWELIVVDDGSTDDTPAVLARYAHDGRIRVLRQKNQGASVALNRGIAAARGDLVCWLSADDIFLPAKLAAQVAVFTGDPEVGLCCTGFELIDAVGRRLRSEPEPRWRHPDPLVSIYWTNPINGSTVMMRRELFDELGPFDETLRADVDADMWFRVARHHAIRTVPGVMLRYRVHDKALSANLPLMKASVTSVRLGRLADGTLLERLRASDPDRGARTLARMSRHFALRGFPEVGRALFDASRRAGHAPWQQAPAALAVISARWARPHLGVLRRFFQVRRSIWRLRESTRPAP
jgi:hypothetical protein